MVYPSIWVLGTWTVFFCVCANGCASFEPWHFHLSDIEQTAVSDRREPTVNGCEVFARITEGWNGLRWGATKDEFRCRCPDIRCREGDRLLVREKFRTRFLGCRVKPCYGFNRMGRFAWVMLIPDMADRCRVREKMIQALGQGIASDPIWRRGDLQIEVNLSFHTVIITNRQLEGK